LCCIFNKGGFLIKADFCKIRFHLNMLCCIIITRISCKVFRTAWHKMYEITWNKRWQSTIVRNKWTNHWWQWLTGDRPDLSSDRAPHRDNTATFRQKISRHTDWLTDRQS
jgi:hypothetical protein